MTLLESPAAVDDLDPLDLTESRLSSLPDSVLHETRLRRLWLDDNELASLPESLGDLEALDQLFVDGNLLATG